MNNSILSRPFAALASALLVSIPFAAANADSGFYIGGSVGNATVEANVSDPTLPSDLSVDEDDFAWKAFGGYTFDLPTVELGIEAGYVDLGGPSVDVLGQTLSLDTTGLSAYGVAGVGLGPVHVFGKFGLISWDVDVDAFGESFSDDGSDTAYGVGVRFGLGPVDVRGEYEIFDISEVDDVTLLSVGITWMF